MSGVHGGLNVIVGLTPLTPSSSPTNSRIWSVTCGPIGHPGEVSVKLMFTSPPSTSISYTRPSSTKSSPSSGSITLVRASSTSSTDGMRMMLVASGRASAGADSDLRAGAARGAVRDHQGGRSGPGSAAHDRPPRTRLARRRVAHEVAGTGRLAPLHRDDERRPDPAPRDSRRRARHLRRRVPYHARLHHRHPRVPAADPADARAVQARAPAPPRDARDPRPRAQPPRRARLRRGHGDRARAPSPG